MNFARNLSVKWIKSPFCPQTACLAAVAKPHSPDSEIMPILIVFHFGLFRNFKHYYQFFIRQHLGLYIPRAVSYNRFVEL